MIERHSVPIASIARVAPSDVGAIGTLYEPESALELEQLCRRLIGRQLPFDLVGHTSNILYTSGYKVDRMVSTRKVDHYEIRDDAIRCECGANVRLLSTDAIQAGCKGFEGLVDLPGTVGSALYGNAGCYDCSVSDLLTKATLLMPDGTVQTVAPDWFQFTKRSSVLKRHEQQAIILTATLRRDPADAEALCKMADENHRKRRFSQPGPKNGLGSVFGNSGEPTPLQDRMDSIYHRFEKLFHWDEADIKTQRETKAHLALRLLGDKALLPYVRTWNWYQWNDDNAHKLFWRYVRLHRQMFTRSDFEIEIKGLSRDAIERLIAAE